MKFFLLIVAAFFALVSTAPAQSLRSIYSGPHRVVQSHMYHFKSGHTMMISPANVNSHRVVHLYEKDGYFSEPIDQRWSPPAPAPCRKKLQRHVARLYGRRKRYLP